MRVCCAYLLFVVAYLCCAGEAISKEPVPDAASQQSALQTIASIYKPDYESAKTPQQKQELAKKLMSVGVATTDDATGRFVLLRVARDIAAQESDIPTAFKCIEHMTESFEVDPLPMKLTVVQTAAQEANGYLEHQALADQIAPCVDDAIASDQYDIAKSFCELALKCAQEGRDPNKAQLIQGRMLQVEEMGVAFEQVRTAMQMLQSDPENPEANAVVGRYLSLIKGEWDSGLKLIASGNEADLKALALLEAGPNPDPVQIADRWWSLGQSLDGLERFNVDVHAANWYQKALSGTSGLTKARITERLKNLPPPTGGDGQMENASDETVEPSESDLLEPIQTKKVDIADIVVRGSANAWEWTNAGLTYRNEQPSRIEFPNSFPSEYELVVDLTVSGQQTFSDVHLALPIGNNRVPFTVRRKDRKTLFSFWGGKGFGQDPKIGNYLAWTDGPQHHVINIRVRKDRIEIGTKGKTVLKIEDIDYIRQEAEKAFAITTSTPIVIHSIKLTDLSQTVSQSGTEGTQGASRHAIKFDGSKSYGIVPTFRYKGDHPITIEAKIQLGQNGVAFPISSSTGKDGLSIQVDDENWIFSVGSPQKPVHLFSGEAVNPVRGKWIHLAAVFDGRQAWLFIDGKLRDTKFIQGGYLPSQSPLLFGVKRSANAGKTWYFGGEIKEVRISKIARYKDDFAVQDGILADKDTILFLPFEEGKGNSSADASGNGHSVTLSGCEWQ